MHIYKYRLTPTSLLHFMHVQRHLPKMDLSFSSSSSSPPPNPNSNPNPTSTSQFDLLYQYLMLEEGSEGEYSYPPITAAAAITAPGNDHVHKMIHTAPPAYDWERTSEETDHGAHVIAFRTKSELDVIDDGFKWRKYGKKMVKSSPNPRNYYKCSSGGCDVKKRIERDMEDSSYVITTYTGIHNHPIPGVGYHFNQLMDA